MSFQGPAVKTWEREEGPCGIFLDMDGTLCLPGQFPSPKTVSALEKAQANGHLIFLCTGRGYPMIPKDILSLPWDGLIWGIGAYAQLRDQTVLDQPYPAREVARLSQLFMGEGLAFLAEGKDAVHSNLTQFHALKLTPGQGINREVEAMLSLVQDGVVTDWSRYSGQPVYKMAFLSAENDQLSRLKAELEKDYHVAVHPAQRPGFVTDVELVRRDVNKGSALRRMCHTCGIPVSRSVAFGDSANDGEMLAAAGWGVAMGNGDHYIKSHADQICPGVTEDGLCTAFLDLGLI